MDAVDHPPQVHAEDPPPTLERHRPDRAARADAGVVAHDVDGVEGLESSVAQMHDVGGDRDVGMHADRLGARGAKLFDGRLEAGVLDVGEHDLHALGCKTVRQRSPDPARPSRHHRHFAR
jgi:hypothetical protein